MATTPSPGGGGGRGGWPTGLQKKAATARGKCVGQHAPDPGPTDTALLQGPLRDCGVATASWFRSPLRLHWACWGRGPEFLDRCCIPIRVLLRVWPPLQGLPGSGFGILGGRGSGNPPPPLLMRMRGTRYPLIPFKPCPMLASCALPRWLGGWVHGVKHPTPPQWGWGTFGPWAFQNPACVSLPAHPHPPPWLSVPL